MSKTAWEWAAVVQRGVCVAAMVALASTAACGNSAGDLADGRTSFAIDAMVTLPSIDAHDDARENPQPLDAGSTSNPADAAPSTRDAAVQPPPDAAAAPPIDASTNHASDAAIASIDAYVPSCGNGIVDPGEICDDGTNGPGTCCAADCSADLTCSGGGINFDFNTGGVFGNIVWQGGATSNVSGEFMASLSNGSSTYPTDSFQFSNLAPANNYSLDLYSNECGSEHLETQSNINVAANLNTAADFDITNVAGHISGDLTLNGTAMRSAILYLNDGCHLSFNGSHFDLFMPPGDYVATISDGNNTLGTVSFTSTAAQTTATGTTDFEFHPGAIAGSILWGGSATSNASGEFMTALSNGATTYPTGSYEFGQVAPSTYAIDLYSNECGSEHLTTLSNVVVADGQSVTADFDITNAAGHISGDLTLNGTAMSSAILYLNDGCHLSFNGSHFDLFMPPGDYVATVSDGNNTLGTVSFTSTAAHTTATGTSDFEFHPGSIAGAILWNGTAVTNSTGEFMATLSNGSSTYPVGSYEFTQLPPATYSIDLYSNECGAEQLGALSDVTVAASQAVTADFDITDTAGVVSGNVLLNGQPLDFAILYFSDGCHVAVYNGQFNVYLPPGDYSTEVSDGSNTLGTFDFTITAGQTTSYDDIPTPTGAAVSISAAGGLANIGGLQLVFGDVTAAGDTNVITSSQGPAAPSGHAVIGVGGAARYWQVTSSASLTGAIQICTQYDPSAFTGNANSLELVDATNAFTNITTSNNTSTQVICGSTSALSTFAVIAPQ